MKWAAIISGIAIVCLTIVIVSIYFRRKASQELGKSKGWADRGDLNSAQEKALIAEVDQAEHIFRRLIAPKSFADYDNGDITILSMEDKDSVNSWLDNYSTTTRKGLGR